jgi:hypothetical protein
MQIFRQHRVKQPNLTGGIDMRIQIKDLPVVQEIAVSEMSAMRGGIGSQGLSGGTVRSGMSSQDAIKETALNDLVFSDGYSFGASNPANIGRLG